MRRIAAGILLFACTAVLCAGEGAVKRSNPKTYHVTVGAEVTVKTGKLSDFVLNIPIPESSQYQDVVPLGKLAGEVRTIPETGDRYSHIRPKLQNTLSGANEFTITVYEIETDFEAISPRQYNKNSAEYKKYTAASGEYVVPNHPKIVRIVNSLSGGADTIGFARRAYDYVAQNFTYRDPRTGIHTLDDIFAKGGGDCGSLSSVYISLLRSKGIPARHLAGRKASNGSLHIISEFYVEGYGWIPVDVTYRNSKPKVDYFGRIRASDRLIILSRDVSLTLHKRAGQTWKADTLQTFKYWWWGSKGSKFTQNTLFKAVPH